MRGKLWFILLVTLLAMSACAVDNSEKIDDPSGDLQNITPSVDEPEVHYNLLSADWPVYQSASELIEAGNVIVLGKLTNITFQMLDRTTAKPPTADSEESNCYLNTIYDVEVITSYKGVATNTIQVRMLGGQEGVFLKEQLAVLGDRADEGIYLMEGMPTLRIGETYLFVLYQYNDAMPTLVNVWQGVYPIDRPLEKDPYSYVSTKEIIVAFGEDKWAAFEAGEYATE